MKPTLVTGGCGFVGRHVVLRLLSEGRNVWIVDNLSVGQPPDEWLPEQYQKQVTFVRADVRAFWQDYFSPKSSPLYPEGKAPAFGDVFHFAAVVGGRAVISGDPLAVATDLAIDSDLFNWAVKVQPDRVLYPSSSAAYPCDLQEPGRAVALREDMIEFGGRLGQPDMTYGWSKLTGEYLARTAAAHYGLHVACVRPFSGFGEDQDRTYPIPAIAARAARRENPFEVWGTGEQGRDFVYIEDVVDAMLLALDKISDGSAVNIGSGKLMSFQEVIQIFCRIAGYAPEIKPLLDKPMGTHSRFADMTYAKKLLGWEPKIPVEEGFRRVYEAARQRLSDP